ncbi:MAG: hypothetical protein ABIK92_00490 [Pseudomonadota bacterium]
MKSIFQSSKYDSNFTQLTFKSNLILLWLSLIIFFLSFFACTSGHTDATTPTVSGSLSLIAGSTGGPGEGDGVGSEARFRLSMPNEPRSSMLIGIATDAAGNVYLADSGNHTIRKITPAGVVTTLAGVVGKPGSADGVGTTAQFNYPSGITIDKSGNLFVADKLNFTIRKITPSGFVTTIAGTAGKTDRINGIGSAARFRGPQGIVADKDDNLYVIDNSQTIRKITTDGVVSTVIYDKKPHFSGIAVDAAGNIYASWKNAVRKINPAGVVSILAGKVGIVGSNDGIGNAARFGVLEDLTIDAAGNLYVCDCYNSTIRKISPAGAVTTIAGTTRKHGSSDGIGPSAQFRRPCGIALDKEGNLYIADQGNTAIRKITPEGVVSTLAGSKPGDGHSDGAGAAAQFNNPGGITSDSAGNMYVADYGNNVIRKITPDGLVSTLAGKPGIEGSADGRGADALFYGPADIAVDTTGNLYVADKRNATIRKITPDGMVSTLAGKAGKKDRDDGLGELARFYSPSGITVGGGGNIYVADGSNDAIRRITHDGMVTTFAKLSYPSKITSDTAGNLYVSRSKYIVKITPEGKVKMFAGGNPFSDADFSTLYGLVTDEAGYVYVADGNNQTIHRITPRGNITTVAGIPRKQGIVTGVLPGGLDCPVDLARIGPNTFAITTGNAVLKLVIR